MASILQSPLSLWLSFSSLIRTPVLALGPWLVQDNFLPPGPSLHYICLVPLPCKVAYSQVLQIRTWTWGSHCLSAHHPLILLWIHWPPRCPISRNKPSSPSALADGPGFCTPGLPLFMFSTCLPVHCHLSATALSSMTLFTYLFEHFCIPILLLPAAVGPWSRGLGCLVPRCGSGP